MTEASAGTAQPRDILDQLLTEAFFRPERLPGLHATYDKSAIDCIDDITPYVSSEFSFTFNKVHNATAESVLAGQDDGRVWTVLQASQWDSPVPVSYTHLTLPTNREV